VAQLNPRLAIVLLISACGSDPQLPPTDQAAMAAWLDDAPYTAWSCEPEQHPSRNGSPHGPNRICSNARLSGNTDTSYPVGAATVKELWKSDGSIGGHSVMRKVTSGRGGADWYFFERFDGRIYASSTDSLACTGCHERAGSGGMPGKDFVFTQVD
jgi:hypothetical protein